MAGDSLMDWLDYMGKKHGFTSSAGPTETYSDAVYTQKNADGSQAELVGGKVELFDGGVSVSGALAKAELDGISTTIGGGEFKSGFIDDGEHQFFGTKVGVTGVKDEVDFQKALGLRDDLVIKADGSALTAGGEVSIRDDGFTLSAGASIVEGSVTLGTTGTGDRDETTRIGLSAGPSAAGRLHWGDADGDGNPEYGIGADVEFLSFDIKTEDPLRTAMKQVNVGGLPLGAVASEFIDGNMTNDAIQAGGETIDAASQAAADLKQRAEQELQAARAEADRMAQDLQQRAAQELEAARVEADRLAKEAAQGLRDAGATAQGLADQAADGLSNLFSSDD